MASITLHISNGKHERLKLLAQSQGVSLNKLVEEWAGMALAQFDVEARFHARGRAGRGLALLDKLENALAKQPNSGKKA